MKLILTADVDHLGVAGDIVEVKDGYGRNLLLPRGLAIVATPGAEKQVQSIRRAQQTRTIRDNDHAREIREQLDQLEGVTVKVRTSEKGKIFGSVKADDIVSAVAKAGGPYLDKRSIEMPKPYIKKTGNYQVRVNLVKDIIGKVNFKVVSVSE